MIVRLVCVIIFSALAAVAVQAADGKPPATGLAVAQAQTAPTSSSASEDEEGPPPPLEPMTPIVIPPEMPGAPGYKEPTPAAPATTPAPAPSGKPSPAAAGDAIFKVPNYNLVGVTSVVYSPIIPERLFSHNDDDCKINSSELNAAIDLVASQSNKLKFFKFAAHSKRSRELWAKRDELFKEYMNESKRAREAALAAHQKTEEALQKAQSEAERVEISKEDLMERDNAYAAVYQKAQEAYEKAQSEAVIFASMPRLVFFVTVAKVEHSCVAKVEGNVSAITEGHAKFAATGQDAISSSTEMWSAEGTWLKAPDKEISAFVISTTETLMKKFIDEWIPASCLKPNALMCENP